MITGTQNEDKWKDLQGYIEKLTVFTKFKTAMECPTSLIKELFINLKSWSLKNEIKYFSSSYVAMHAFYIYFYLHKSPQN